MPPRTHANPIGPNRNSRPATVQKPRSRTKVPGARERSRCIGAHVERPTEAVIDDVEAAIDEVDAAPTEEAHDHAEFFDAEPQASPPGFAEPIESSID